MIYTTQPGQSFDAELLRQELVKAIGPDGWSLQTAGNTVELRISNGDLIDKKFYQQSADDFNVGKPDKQLSAYVYEAAEPVVLAHFANSATRDHNKSIDADIAAMEAKTPITHRTQREFMLGVQKLIAQTVGITEVQMLDPQNPNHSHAYAAFKAFNDATVTKRAERINK